MASAPDVGLSLIVAMEGRSPQHWLHCADVVLAERPSLATAAQWLGTAFVTYPGCALAVVRCGQCCLLAARDEFGIALRAMALTAIERRTV